jgi:hypothetical protein
MGVEQAKWKQKQSGCCNAAACAAVLRYTAGASTWPALQWKPGTTDHRELIYC